MNSLNPADTGILSRYISVVQSTFSETIAGPTVLAVVIVTTLILRTRAASFSRFATRFVRFGFESRAYSISRSIACANRGTVAAARSGYGRVESAGAGTDLA